MLWNQFKTHSAVQSFQDEGEKKKYHATLI